MDTTENIENRQSKLIILRGNSGSGKSSVARELQRKFGRGTLIIPQDTVRRELLHARDGADTKALPLLIDLLEYGKRNCAVTILEGILYADWYRPLFRKALEEYGPANIYAYYYDLPFEETLRRHATKPNRFEFGEEDMRRNLAFFCLRTGCACVIIINMFGGDVEWSCW